MLDIQPLGRCVCGFGGGRCKYTGADPAFLKGGGGSISGADTGFPEGGVKTFTSTPPLGHCPRDVIRPPKN